MLFLINVIWLSGICFYWVHLSRKAHFLHIMSNKSLKTPYVNLILLRFTTHTVL